MRIVLTIIALVLILLAGLVGTTAGLKAGIHIADRLLPGELRAGIVGGRLLDHIELRDVSYRNEFGEIEIDTLTLDWRGPALLRRTLLVDSLRIGTLQILSQVEDRNGAVGVAALPLAVDIRRLDIGAVVYRDTVTDAEFKFRRLHGRASARDDKVELQQLSLAGEHYIVELRGQLRLAEDWPVTATFSYSIGLPELPPELADVDGHGEITGDLRMLNIAHQTTAPLNTDLEITLTDVIDNPAWRGRLHATAIELRSLADIEGHADIDIEFEGTPDATSLRADVALAGELTADWALTMDLAHTQYDRFDITSLAFEDRGRHFDLVGTARVILADVPGFEFAAEWRYRDEHPITGKLQLDGHPDDYRVMLTAVMDQPLASGWSLHGRGDSGSLTVETLRGELADGLIEAGGLIDWRADSPLIKLAGSWSGLTLAVDDEFLINAPGGEFSVSGTTEYYTLELSGDLAAGDWPAAAISLTASGTADGLDITALELGLLDGRLHADGHADWSAQPRLQLNLDGEDLDPGSHWPDWPGRMDITTTLFAEHLDDDWQIALQDLVVQGVLREYPLQASGNLFAGADEYRIEKLAIHSGDSQLTADGFLGHSSDLAWQLRSPDLAQLWPEAGGSIDGRGHLRGRLAAPEVHAVIAGEHIHTPWLKAESAQAAIDLDTTTDRFDANIDITGVQAAEQLIEQMTLESQGLLERHSLMARVVTPDRQLDLEGSGSLQDDTWHLNLDQAAIKDPAAGNWQLAQSLGMSLSQTAISIEPHCWQQQAARLCGHGGWQRAGAWRVETELTGLRLGEHVTLPEHLPPLTGALESRLSASGQSVDIESLNGSLRLSAASLQPADEFEPMIIDDLSIEITDVPDGARLVVDGRFGGTYPGELQGDFKTGRLRIDPDALAATAIEGQVKASVGDLRPLIAVYTDLDARQATATLDARIDGRIGKPDLTGSLKLTAATITVIEAGLELAEVELQIDGAPDGELTINGLATSAPGKLTFDGRLQIVDTGIRIASLDITGEDFETLNLPEAWVLTSPDLQVEHDNDVIQISGDISVPEAMLEPLEAGGAIRVSPDEEIVTPDVTEPPADPLQIAATIRLRLGDEVRVRGPGFSGRLTGSLDIRQQPGRPATAEGMLNIVDGVYGAYGQELRITTGQLIYTGQALDDPQLNIRAVRSIGAVEAGIRAFGSARRPEAELFSTPSMPEADILAYLVVGRPVSGLTSGEGNMLLDAAVAMGIRGTESLRQNIAGVLGLDELTLTAGGLDDTDARLTVGKYLTPRLYISYAAGLVETAIDTMRLRYTISRRLSLEAEQGSGTGADLLYQIER